MSDIVNNEGKSLREIMLEAEKRDPLNPPPERNPNGRSEYAPPWKPKGEQRAQEPEQEIQQPPHPDEIETAISNKMNGFLEEQSALAKQRLREHYAELEELTRILDKTQKRAAVALRAYSQALITLRRQTESSSEVVKELRDGLRNVDDAVRNHGTSD